MGTTEGEKSERNNKYAAHCRMHGERLVLTECSLTLTWDTRKLLGVSFLYVHTYPGSGCTFFFARIPRPRFLFCRPSSLLVLYLLYPPFGDLWFHMCFLCIDVMCTVIIVASRTKGSPSAPLCFNTPHVIGSCYPMFWSIFFFFFCWVRDTLYFWAAKVILSPIFPPSI